MEALTIDEILAILRAARGSKRNGIRNWAMILLAFKHGFRATEVCRLRLTNLVDDHLDVQRLKGSKRTIQPLEPHRGEPLLDEVKAIKAWMAERPTDAGDALFVSQKGNCMTATQFYRIYHDVAKACGLPKSKSHPHVLKHSCGTMMARQNVNAFMIQQKLGHASISSTAKYVSVTDSEASKACHNAFMIAFAGGKQ